MDRIKFGTEVVCTHKLVLRKKRKYPGTGIFSTAQVIRDYQVQKLDEPIRGFVVRQILLKEGMSVWNTEYWEFEETKTVKAYEIAWHNTRKPLLILPEHVNIAELGHE